MANRFAVTGTGSWDGTNTGIWAATSGGASGASAPTAADDVFLDATSPAVTIASGAVGRSLNCTGYTGTLTHTAAVTLTLGDATAGAGNVALLLVAGMTYTLGNSTSSALSFITTSTTQQTIDFAGKTTGNVTYNALGGSYIYNSAHTTTGTLTLSQGILNTNNLTCSWGVFSSNVTGNRTLTFGSSTINMTGGSTIWTVGGIATNLTITTNTATINVSSGSAIFNASNINYNGASIIFTGAGTSSLNGGPTMQNVTRTGSAVKTDGFNLNATLTVVGLLTLTGNSSINRLLVQSSAVNSPRTINAATVSISNVDFMDMTGTGAAAPFTGTLLGDAGGNSGITFTTPATQTWSGTSGGNWSTNAWTSRVPLPQDTAIINAAFTGGQTVTQDMPRIGGVDWTGATGSPVWAVGNIATSAFGSIILASGMSTSLTNTLTLAGRGSYTLTSNGVAYSNAIILLRAPGGTYSLGDNFTMTNGQLFNGGTMFGGLSLNNFVLTCRTIDVSGTNTRSLTMGTGTINLNDILTGTPWNVTTAGLTFSGASGTIVYSAASGNTRTFAGAGLTYGTFTYNVPGSTGTLVITGANTFNTINFSDITNARILQFTAATTTTITGAFNVFGTAGKLMSIQSVTAATHTLSKASGVVSTVDYVNLTNSIATGGATWYAGANSVDSGGNTGWIFTAVPPVGPTVISIGRSSSLASLGLASLARL